MNDANHGVIPSATERDYRLSWRLTNLQTFGDTTRKGMYLALLPLTEQGGEEAQVSQTERERSREQGDAYKEGSEDKAERVQQFGAVFYITVAISALFVLAGVFFTEPFGNALATVVGYITDYLGWLYMLMTSFFLAFAVCLALSRYGKIRLGQADDRPEFSHFAWFAMLFQAGMGIGLVFWAVSEPLTRTTWIHPSAWPSRRRRTPPRWLCRPRSSTGVCTRGRSTPSSASPSPTSATVRA